jgi:hypothetical protein
MAVEHIRIMTNLCAIEYFCSCTTEFKEKTSVACPTFRTRSLQMPSRGNDRHSPRPRVRRWLAAARKKFCRHVFWPWEFEMRRLRHSRKGWATHSLRIGDPALSSPDKAQEPASASKLTCLCSKSELIWARKDLRSVKLELDIRI